MLAANCPKFFDMDGCRRDVFSIDGASFRALRHHFCKVFEWCFLLASALLYLHTVFFSNARALTPPRPFRLLWTRCTDSFFPSEGGGVRSAIYLSPSKTGFIVPAHRLINITLLTLVQLHCGSKGSRRPMSLMRTHTQ